MSQLLNLNSSFDKEVLEQKGLYLIDFWAPWCRYCIMLEPTLESLASDFHNKGLRVVKVNVDDTPEIAQRYGVMSLPTLKLFKDGKELDVEIFDRDEESLKELIKKYL